MLLATYRTPQMAGVPGNTRGDDFSHWTAVVTEIDPNLQIGLHAERATRFGDFWRGKDVQIGIKLLVDALRFRALDVGKLRELLVRRDAADQLFRRLTRQGVVEGVPIEIAHEGAPGRLELAVRGRFPHCRPSVER